LLFFFVFVSFCLVDNYWTIQFYILSSIKTTKKATYEEEQTTQWPKEKVQKDKQRSTEHTYKTKDRVTRTPLNQG
jgi:hypothetical protein